MAKRTWSGSTPFQCQVCGRKFSAEDKHFYDFKTQSRIWAIGCESCWKKVGCGLGTGLGQKYDLKSRLKVG